jgi:hypothetical protein
MYTGRRKLRFIPSRAARRFIPSRAARLVRWTVIVVPRNAGLQDRT